MRALNAVVEEGGISAAARRLGVSQPAVTQHIRDLQAEFDVMLFERKRGSLIPTALCRELYKLTSEIRELEDEALRLLNRQEVLDRGELRVGLGNAMPGMRLIGDFQRNYPNIEVQVEMGSWTQIVDAVVEQRVDVAILPEVPDEKRFHRILCAEHDVVALVPPGSELADMGQVTLQQLVKWPLIFRTEESSTQRAVDAAFASVNIKPKPAMVLDTRDGVMEAVAHGLGVGFVWRLGSSRQVDVKKIPVRELSKRVQEHAFHLSHPVPRIAPHFMEIVRQSRLTG
ncbi:MAG: LysR family transcriptional regulator [Pseudomonadota bacterium]